MSPNNTESLFISALGASALVVLAAGADVARAQTAQNQTVEADGNTYAYRVSGPEGGTPLVLSQRFRGTMDDWDPSFIDALDDERQVIVFDAAGVSSSSGNVPDTIPAMADDMAAFIRALGHREVDVLGWSMGGFVVQSLAINHPDLVDRLILVGTGPAGSAETPAPTDGVFDVATRPQYGSDEREYLFFADAPSSLNRAEASMQRIDALRDLGAEPATTPQVMQAQATAIQTWFSGSGGEFAKLSEIDSPTMIVSGDRDPFFPIMGPVLLYREIPNARLAVYPMAGHGPHHQWPDHVSEIVSDFLSDTAE